MIASFKDQGAEDVYRGRDTAAARKVCPVDLWRIAKRKLDAINQAVDLTDLRRPPSNHLEPLRGNRAGQHSIRVNDKYRVCFVWKADSGHNVEITDYH